MADALRGIGLGRASEVVPAGTPSDVGGVDPCRALRVSMRLPESPAGALRLAQLLGDAVRHAPGTEFCYRVQGPITLDSLPVVIGLATAVSAALPPEESAEWELRLDEAHWGLDDDAVCRFVDEVSRAVVTLELDASAHPEQALQAWSRLTDRAVELAALGLRPRLRLLWHELPGLLEAVIESWRRLPDAELELDTMDAADDVGVLAALADAFPDRLDRLHPLRHVMLDALLPVRQRLPRADVFVDIEQGVAHSAAQLAAGSSLWKASASAPLTGAVDALCREPETPLLADTHAPACAGCRYRAVCMGYASSRLDEALLADDPGLATRRAHHRCAVNMTGLERVLAGLMYEVDQATAPTERTLTCELGRVIVAAEEATGEMT